MKFSRPTITLALLIILSAASIMAATPEVPRLISYQGYLTDAGGSAIADGAHVVQFRIWNDPAAVAPANEKWWSGVTAVTTTNGLFDVHLGHPGMNPIDPDIFVDSNLWLGVTLGADPEIAPRTKLTTSPYAFTARLAQTATEAGHAATADALTAPVDHGALTGLADDDHDQYVLNTGDDMTGNLDLYSAGTRYGAVTTQGGHQTYDLQGNLNARIHGNGWGQIDLWDGQVSNINTIELNAQSSTGGEMIVRNSAGSQTHRLDAGNSGNSSVIFPNDAISADETLEEPGIARAEGSTTLNDGAVINITSRSITVPGPGYIVAIGHGYGQINGNSIGNILFYVATSASGTASGDYVVFGSSDETISASEYRWGALSTERTFSVGAGTHTYYLNAYQGWDGGSASVLNAKLTLLYFPTNYGTVTAIAANDEVDQFDQVTAIQTTTGEATGNDVPITLYSVDLQELVNKAKKARLAAEKAELELQIALTKENGPNKNTAQDK